METAESRRIKKRVKKARRRVAARKRIEEETARIARLETRLRELEAGLPWRS